VQDFVFGFPVLYSGVCDEHHPKYSSRHSLFPYSSGDYVLDGRSRSCPEKEHSFRAQTKCSLAYLDFPYFSESSVEYEPALHNHPPEYCFSPWHKCYVAHHGNQNEFGECGTHRYPNHRSWQRESNYD
jgi:hypothetical protein